MRPQADPDQLELFDEPPVDPVPPGRPVPPSRARVVWSKYRPQNPVKCDDCMHALAAAKGNAPASRRARFRRVQGQTVLLVCDLHAMLRREADGVNPPG